MLRLYGIDMTNETKMLIGVLGVTVLIIVGGAYLMSGGSDESGAESVAEAERLVKDNAPAVYQGEEGRAGDFSEAKVTVVEFSDFECPACGSVAPLLKQLYQQNADKSVRFVYRIFPLSTIHDNAQLAAEAAMAALDQGKFWSYLDLLFANQEALEKENLLAYAEQVGLDMDMFTKQLDERVFKQAVNEDSTDGNVVGIKGTPSFFVNGVLYKGQYSLAGFQAAIDVALGE